MHLEIGLEAETAIEQIVTSSISLLEQAVKAKRLAGIRRRLWRRLKRLFDEQGEEVAKRLGKVRLNQPKLEQSIEELEAAEILFRIFNPEGETTHFFTVCLPLLEEAAKAGLDEGMRKISLGWGFDVPHEASREWLKDYASEVLKTFENMTETTTQMIREALAEGLKEGESVQDLMERVKGVYSDMSDYRAERIARTETANAYETANFESYKEVGVRKKSWHRGGGELECEICDGNEDEGAIDIDTPFSSGHMHPPGHPNCDCDLIPEIEEGWEPTI